MGSLRQQVTASWFDVFAWDGVFVCVLYIVYTTSKLDAVISINVYILLYSRSLTVVIGFIADL